MVVEVDVNPAVIDEALRINEPPQVQSPSDGLDFSGNQSVEALNAQIALQNAVAAFRNAFGMIDVGEAEANGVVTIERDPLKAKEGARWFILIQENSWC